MNKKKGIKSGRKAKKNRNADHSPYLIALKESLANANSYPETPSGFSPLSGSEPVYQPKKWNDRHRIKHTHNCYAYALDAIMPSRMGKPQPGYFSNFPPLQSNDYYCEEFYRRIKKDNPNMYLTSYEERCKPGFYKAFIALDDKKEDQDYHFWRQGADGYFDHKPGRTEATNLDASGNPIINPLIANRSYRHFQYTKPCFFFCLNPDLSKAHSRSAYTY